MANIPYNVGKINMNSLMSRWFNTYNADIFAYQPWRPKSMTIYLIYVLPNKYLSSCSYYTVIFFINILNENLKSSQIA